MLIILDMLHHLEINRLIISNNKPLSFYENKQDHLAVLGQCVI